MQNGKIYKIKFILSTFFMYIFIGNIHMLLLKSFMIFLIFQQTKIMSPNIFFEVIIIIDVVDTKFIGINIVTT